MKINQLPADLGKQQEPKRKGRGIGSGNGKTSGRGHKGQHARAGGFHRVGFEGGQMPLQRRLPKRGFTNNFKTEYALVKVGSLSEAFEAHAEVRIEDLVRLRLIGSLKDGVKLLAGGDLDKPLRVYVTKASQSAVAQVEAAGGQVFLAAEA